MQPPGLHLKRKGAMEDSSADRQAVDDVENIVARAQAGEQAAFGALYEMYYDQIYRYLSFKCGSRSEAEDLASDVFLKMVESIGSFEFRGFPFTSWLYRIAHNAVVDNFRRKGRRPTVPLDDMPNSVIGATHSDMEHQVQIGWEMENVLEAMDGLTDLQREVITLRFAASLSIAETARTVGRSQNAVKALQHSGIRKLRVSMQESGFSSRESSVTKSSVTKR